jgi:hypothetical protein
MALCPKCGKRLAKRTCPALGVALCQLCCGRVREKELHCPPACPHLSAHKPYQEKRVIERKSPEVGKGKIRGQDILDDERLAWLALHIEAGLAGYAAGHPDFSDKDALLAVEYARERSEKGPSRLIISGEALKPVNSAGEAVLRAVETCRFQGSALLAAGIDVYKREEKVACLERIARGIRVDLGGGAGGRSFLRDLSRRFARPGGEAREKKLVTLT